MLRSSISRLKTGLRLLFETGLSWGWGIWYRILPIQTPEKILPKRIIVVTASAIGDVVLATPVFRTLRAAYPEARIAWLSKPEGARVVLEGSPFVDEVYEFDLFSRSPHSLYRFLRTNNIQGFDLCVNLLGKEGARAGAGANARYRIGRLYQMGFHKTSRHLLDAVVCVDPEQHRVEQNLSVLKPLNMTLRKDLYFHLTEADKAFAKRFWQAQGLLSKKVVGLHIGEDPEKNVKEKCWGLTKYIALAQRIKCRDVAILLVGGPNERSYRDQFLASVPEAITVVGQTSLRETAALIQRCDAFVSNDSGPMHIAGSVGTPVIGIFGPTNSRVTGPWGDHSRGIALDLYCQPCYVAGSDRPITCTNPEKFACFSRIEVDQVFIELLDLLR